MRAPRSLRRIAQAADAAIARLPMGPRKSAYEHWLADRQAAVQLELLKQAVLSLVEEADKAIGDTPKGVFDSESVVINAGAIGAIDATRNFLPVDDSERALLARTRARMFKYIDEQIRALLAELDAAEQDAIGLDGAHAPHAHDPPDAA